LSEELVDMAQIGVYGVVFVVELNGSRNAKKRIDNYTRYSTTVVMASAAG